MSQEHNVAHVGSWYIIHMHMFETLIFNITFKKMKVLSFLILTLKTVSEHRKIHFETWYEAIHAKV